MRPQQRWALCHWTLAVIGGRRDGGYHSRKGQIMARGSSFPPNGFLLLGVLSLAASALFVVRAVSVEATTERVWSAILFGGFGVFWLAAYWSTRRQPTS